ncbi:MAG TPA: cytochrome c oxidase subunit II [Solirubrobacteraceae bacterium]|nr:cytochrome c oxidase subunit II [Solirubrobacteraceae bacterium]
MGPRRRTFLLALLACAISLLALAGVASANALAPETGGSPNADRTHTIYVVLLVISAVVFFGVEGLLLYTVVRFRARKGAVAAQIRGNTRLEIGWTVATAVVLLGIVIFTLVELRAIKNPDRSGANGFASSSDANLYASLGQPAPPGKGLKITATGRQFVWRYDYPNGAAAYYELVVPTDTTIRLDIESSDVVHSWWIPKLGGQFDAVPGQANHTWFKVPGKLAGHTFSGACAELCGRGHANMLASVRAVTPPQFGAWVAAQKTQLNEANKAAAAAAATQDPLAGKH